MVSPDEATISVSDKQGKLTVGYCLTVIVPITGVEASETLTLGLGGTETAELNASIQPDNATSVTLTYESSDEMVATADANGVVTALFMKWITFLITAIGDSVVALVCWPS